jgi:hypothetical protein
MNGHLCGEFLCHLDKDGSLKCGHAPEHMKKWLEELNLPMNFLRFMQWSWPQSDGYIAHVSVLSSTSIYTAEATSPLLKHKVLNAGFAPNGDWFVIDYSTEACVPGFITHEEWCPWSAETEDARAFFQPIARSFESFLYRAVERRYLPRDYYVAKEFNAFLVDERNG